MRMKETHAVDVETYLCKESPVILCDLSDHLLKLERWIACELA